MLSCLCIRNPLPNSDGTQTYNAIEARGFRLLHKALIISLCSSLILVPVGVLYLGGPNKPISFVVVVVSGIAFAIALVIIEKRIGHVVVGVAAYYALLATLLDSMA
ncbi:hypothetical protein HD806DRAFT_502011 [Xylariaceae sp. AK1471]|nr:hypothetical protein HD806DRAFT_502011 [Xylariaceae sp. AK1471]